MKRNKQKIFIFIQRKKVITIQGNCKRIVKGKKATTKHYMNNMEKKEEITKNETAIAYSTLTLLYCNVC